MTNLASPFINRTPSLIVVLWLALMGLTACSSSDNNTTPAPNVNATGYYEGTASIKEEDNSTLLEITDLKAFVNGDQVLIMSYSNVILYELKALTFSDASTYTATVNIYKDATFLTTTTVSGTFTEGTSLTGDFAGSGVGNGSFSVDYSSVNDSDAELATINIDWDGELNSGASATSVLYEIDSLGQFITLGTSSQGPLGSCIISASVTPVVNENLYTMTDMELTDCADSNVNGSNYYGLATTLPFTNRVMAFAFTNGSYSGVGEVPQN